MGCGELNQANTNTPQNIQNKQLPKQQPKQQSKQQNKQQSNQEHQLNFLNSIAQFNNVVKGMAQVGIDYHRRRPPKPSKQEDPLPFFEQEYQHNLNQKKSFNKAQLYHPQSTQAQGLLKLLKTKGNQIKIFNRAEELYKKKKYSEALELYEKINIEDSYIFTQRGYCNYQLQEYDKAIQGFNKSLELKSDFLPTYFRLGRVYIYQLQYKKALEMFQKCLQSCEDTQIYYQLGLSTYYLQKYEESVEFYKKGLQKNPKNAKLVSAIADSYTYMQLYEQSLDWYKKALQIQPKNAQTVSDIGFSLHNLSKYIEAGEWYLKSIEMDPKKAEFYYRLGMNYYWQEMYDQALNEYQKCIQMDPKNENCYMEIGNCKRFMYCYDEAFVWYKKALKINKENKQIYLNMAICKDQSQQWYDAIGLCKKALTIDPQYTYAYIQLGDCYFQTEEYQTAIKNYLLGIQKKTQNLAYCNFMIAKCYFYNEKHLNAIKFFERAIQIDPKKIIYLVYLGKCLLQIQNFAESYEAFNKAKELYEASPDKTQEYDQEQFMIAQIKEFIQRAEEWKQKKKIGYISPEDKQQIKKMRKNFQKKYKGIFGIQGPDENLSNFKPLDRKFLEVVKLIHKDKFSLKITDFASSNISKMATYVRSIYDYDAGSFQIFAYIFQAFMWIQKFQKKKSIMQIQKSLYDVLQLLSDQNPPISKKSSESLKSITFPTYKEIKLNLFKDIVYFQRYDIVVHQIEAINQRAKQDLDQFKQLVYKIQKKYVGSHAKVGMKFPSKKQNMSQLQKLSYQQKLFKVLMRIFQKMFKEVVQEKEQLLTSIDDRIKSNQKIPLYTVNQIIMNTWIHYINQILKSRKNNGVKTECYITDLVRGKCMFQSIQALKNAVNGVVQLCKQKGYQIMQLDNRLDKRTQDIVFKIRIKEVVSELQLALEFDTVTFEFNHNFYEIMRCPLGCIFGSSLLLTKDVSESFLKQVANAMAAVKNIKPVDEQALQSLKFVMNSFKKSSQIQRR